MESYLAPLMVFVKEEETPKDATEQNETAPLMEIVPQAGDENKCVTIAPEPPLPETATKAGAGPSSLNSSSLQTHPGVTEPTSDSAHERKERTETSDLPKVIQPLIDLAYDIVAMTFSPANYEQDILACNGVALLLGLLNFRDEWGEYHPDLQLLGCVGLANVAFNAGTFFFGYYFSVKVFVVFFSEFFFN
jgi:hypothetical protein